MIWSIPSGILLQPGVNVITVTAFDAAGNQATDTLTVTYIPATTSVNWSASGITLQPGANVLTVTAFDAAGNSSQDVITVTLTVAVPPTVTITSPVSVPTYATSVDSVALSGTATGPLTISTVTWVNSRGGAGTASGTASWSIPAIILGSGVNTITVNAQDVGGNIGSDVLTITYTPVTGPLLPVVPPTRPKSITWLLDIGSVHVATRECEVSSVVYRRAILRTPSVDRRLDDSLYGFQDLSRATVEISMRPEFETLWTSEYRGVHATLRRHDWRNGVTVAELDGAVENVSLLPGRVVVDLVDLDLSAFESDLPKATITPTVYGHTACPDAGKAEQKVFGVVPRVPLPYVRDDVVGGQFWYLLSVGTGYTVTKVERDLPSAGQYKPLQTGEYQVRTDLVSGRTLIRTFVRQLNGVGGGGFHKLFADVTGPTVERNFGRALRLAFSDTTWGLGQTIDATSWDTAEADLPTGLFCDGVLDRQRPARDWIDLMLSVRGMRPTRGPSGWRLVVDKAPTTAAMHLGDGPGPGPRTMLRSGTRRRPVPREQVSTYSLKGGLDLVSGEYRIRAAARTVGPLNINGVRVGVEKTDENPFLRDPTSLDMTCCYRAKRMQTNGADRIEGAESTEEGRTLEEGKVIRVTSPRLDVVDLEYQILQVRKDLGRHVLNLVRYANDQYIYDPLPLAVPPVIDQTTTPPAASSLTFVASGTELTGDGTTAAWITVRIVVPSTPAIDSALIDHRRTGTTSYGAAVTVVGEGTHDHRFNGLTPGLSYDFRARTKSGQTTSAAVTLTVVAPGDGTAPAAPTTITPRQSGAARIVEVQVATTLPADWGTTILLRNTVNTPSSASEIARGKVSRFTDRNVNYSTTYFYWARVGDNTFVASGVANITGATTHPNLSGMSPVGSVAVAQSQTADYGPGTVTTEIRGPVIALIGIGAYTLSANTAPVGTGWFNAGTITHNLGRIPIWLPDPGNPGVVLRIYNTTTTQASYILINEDTGAGVSGTASLRYF